MPSGKQTVLANRAGWARTYLKKAGLIKIIRHGCYQITDKGSEALKTSHGHIDNNYLTRFKGFQEFVKATASPSASEKIKTPQEIMDDAYKKMMGKLADELMTSIMARDPAFFERLVIDLLERMGYGGELTHSGEVTGKTGDNGIDGVIRQDALGFDKIYVQAKRWSGEQAV